jgi:hypothetical protein
LEDPPEVRSRRIVFENAVVKASAYFGSVPEGDEHMSGKKILAGIFALMILLKLGIGLINRGPWTALTTVFLEHQVILTIVYLVVLLITGYYIFTGLDIIDAAVVLLFGSTLTGLSLIPYSASLLKLQDEIAVGGLGKAWLSLVIWAVIAIAVLYRVFTGRKQNVKA